MELLRPAVLGCCDSLGVWESGSPLVGGMVAICTPRQPARGFPWVEGTRIPQRRRHRVGPTRLGWQDQVRGTLGEEV